MCGIAGFIDKNECNYENRIKAMCDEITHRGPDAFGIWHDEKNGITLGYRRLSILDLSTNGSQPMVSASGRMVATYNGEIYNYKELRTAISDAGEVIHYKSKCDTEVLLEAFEFLGLEKTLKLARGMFAISLYDKIENCIYLIRDRMGEKPLYYGFYKGKAVFASSLDSIVAYTGKLIIDRHALLQFICYGYIPGTLTIYEGFKKVLPGEYIKIDCDSNMIVDKKLYWNIEKIANEKNNKIELSDEKELTDEFERILSDVISEQMVADVPVGAYLSGGVDSSLIVSLMQKQSSTRVRTYTIGIENGEKSDEAPWAQKVADSLGVNHTTQYITKEKMLDAMLQMGKIFCEPFADLSQIPTYMVSKLAKQDVTITLSGDGGDELFCGYDHYIKYPDIWNNIHNSKKYNQLNYIISKAVLLAPRNKFSDRMMDFKTKYEASSLEGLYRAICESCACGNKVVNGVDLEGIKLDEVPLQSYSNKKLDMYENLMLVDQLQYLPDDILTKVDRTGMAVSLENRIPLLDKRIIEFAWSIPREMKYDGVVTKKIMRNVLYKYVPKELIERPKQGFAFPALGWLIETKELKDWIDELIEKRVGIEGILNKRVIKRLWNEYLGNRSGGHIIWNIVMLLIWADERNILL